MRFHDRDATQIENDHLRVTILNEGGHIAEIFHLETGISPLWIPPWKSIEPSVYDPALHPEYGLNSESKLLAGIMGHNLCLDLFGPPSAEEAMAGMTVHGESSIVRYNVEAGEDRLRATAELPLSGLKIERTLTLSGDEARMRISESVENLSALDRPIAWTEHVTLGPPFLEPGVTRFSLISKRSRVYEASGFDEGNLVTGADFTWPRAPLNGDGSIDLSVFTKAAKSSKFTTHLMDTASQTAFFAAYSPTLKLLVRYDWKREDFPWLGIWEENKARTTPPWNGKTIACGMEFGASPFPETRRQMIDRGHLFGVPAFRWLPAKTRASVDYSVSLRAAEGQSD